MERIRKTLWPFGFDGAPYLAAVLAGGGSQPPAACQGTERLTIFWRTKISMLLGAGASPCYATR